MPPKTFLLLILDGFGISPSHEFNAIEKASMPNWKFLWNNYPHVLLQASGSAVGLPDEQIGNSEVGHMTIGAGRPLPQDLVKITQALNQKKELLKNPVMKEALELGKNHPVHLIGLFSPGGVHSHEHHFYEMIKTFLDADCSDIYLHLFLDGRDVNPKSALFSLEKLIDFCQNHPGVKVASICGRYYAMDRDERWERTELAYDLLTQGKAGFSADNALEALNLAYARGETDEFVKPTWIKAGAAISDGDVVFFLNFRSDRVRQLSRAFLQKDFLGFLRKTLPALSLFLTMTHYDNLPAKVLFAQNPIKNTLGAYLALLGKSQLRIAETEKYPHVTFFLNGGEENLFPNEERILIPSPKVATYDLQPEMSLALLTEKLITAIESKKFDLIVCNLANPDMVGHTGSFVAVTQALEFMDKKIGEIWQALKQANGEMLITADHGNVDCMFDTKTQQAHTAHTLAPVPFLYVGRSAKILMQEGNLADVAPSVLSIMGLPIPIEMTGKAIFKTD